MSECMCFTGHACKSEGLFLFVLLYLHAYVGVTHTHMCMCVCNGCPAVCMMGLGGRVVPSTHEVLLAWVCVDDLLG